MAGGHADGPPDGAAKTVYDVRIGCIEDAAAQARALVDLLEPGERVELVIAADDGRCARFAIDADGARRADGPGAGGEA